MPAKIRKLQGESDQAFVTRVLGSKAAREAAGLTPTLVRSAGEPNATFERRVADLLALEKNRARQQRHAQRHRANATNASKPTESRTNGTFASSRLGGVGGGLSSAPVILPTSREVGESLRTLGSGSGRAGAREAEEGTIANETASLVPAVALAATHGQPSKANGTGVARAITLPVVVTPPSSAAPRKRTQVDEEWVMPEEWKGWEPTPPPVLSEERNLFFADDMLSCVRIAHVSERGYVEQFNIRKSRNLSVCLACTATDFNEIRAHLAPFLLTKENAHRAFAQDVVQQWPGEVYGQEARTIVHDALLMQGHVGAPEACRRVDRDLDALVKERDRRIEGAWQEALYELARAATPHGKIEYQTLVLNKHGIGPAQANREELEERAKTFGLPIPPLWRFQKALGDRAGRLSIARLLQVACALTLVELGAWDLEYALLYNAHGGSGYEAATYTFIYDVACERVGTTERDVVLGRILHWIALYAADTSIDNERKSIDHFWTHVAAYDTGATSTVSEAAEEAILRRWDDLVREHEKKSA